jgi:hypothetical protein
MYVTFYSYVQNGKQYITVDKPAGLQSLPTFDIYLDLPCPHFLLESIFATTNTSSGEMLYKINIPITQELIDSYPVEDGHRLASLWLTHGSDGQLRYTLEDMSSMHSQVLKIDPPHPVELSSLQNISTMFLENIARMQSAGMSMCVQIVFRIPV